ncbi:MAG: hypothetical protein M3N52_02585 [Actinomycetota bacterium]|nr:hypothetical protein [Actinomycetota bacterium]
MAELTLRHPPASAAAGGPGRSGVEVAALAHALLLVVALGVLLHLNRAQWFQDDEWAFVAGRSVLAEPSSLLEPHNEHWSTIPILVYRGLVSLVGARTYLPYVAVNLLLHLTVVHLLWRCMRRCGVRPWVATGLSGVLAVFGAGAENLFWAFQVTWHASLALGLGQLLLIDHHGPPDRRDVVGSGLAVAGLACSGVSIVMVAAAGTYALLRRGWRAALVAVSMPAATYLAWFATFGHTAIRSDPTAPSTLLQAPVFTAIGLDATLEGLTGLPAGGVLMAVGLLAWLLRTAVSRRETAMAAALAAGALLFLGLAAVSRIDRWGLEVARWSRYQYVVGALLMPAVGLALTGLLAFRRSLGTAAVGAGLVWMVAHSALGTVGFARARAGVELADRERLVAVADLGAADARPPIEAKVTPNMELRHLLALRDAGALPDVPLGGRARREAEALLRIGLTDRPALPFARGPRPTVIATARAAVEPAGDCLALRSTGPAAQVALAVEEPGALRVTSEVGGNLFAFVASSGSTDAVPRVRGMRLEPRQPAFLNVDLAEVWVTLGLVDADRATLCGVALPRGGLS